jgi:AmmeMemoRadiSam system protein B
MSVRSRALPPGWYPSGREETMRQIEELRADARPPAGVAPHAGWAFSGQLALEVIGCLAPDTETVVVVGGHLRAADGLVAAFEEGYETPLGVIPADLALLERLRRNLDIREDAYADNTVEVQLPFIRHLLPEAKVLGLRAAPAAAALQLGEALGTAAREGASLAVVGSTDLTHYGSSYGFTPRGTGKEAVQWVREVNDRRLVDALLTMDLEGAIELARRERSACSVGGAVCAARFAAALGVTAGSLLSYRSSYEIHPAESFVGYAAIIYPDNG